ncbi:integrase [Inquilinus ginsengisoli]|uniref:hypothetical protein n=1 Tax=Inquilinus ginsengisoli TaxID=363840 RepID=UPI003D1B5098
MTDLIEDAATPMPAAMPWTPPAGPVALSEAKIAEIKALAQKADQLVEASLSENTRIAYGKAWRAWSDWCLGFGLDPTGENSDAAADERWLVMHLTALSERRSLSTILLRRAAVVAIRKRLKRPLQLDDAEFEAFLKGLRRTKGARPVRKAALLEPNLRAASLVLTPDAHPDLAGVELAGGGGEGRRALRDMALLLIGFAGGFRRSELAAFDLRDVSFTTEGLMLFVGRSKADQERHGAEIGIEAVPGSALCAVTAAALAGASWRLGGRPVLPARPRRQPGARRSCRRPPGW